MNSSLSLGRLIGDSWNIFKANWVFIILFFVAYWFLSQFLSYLPLQLVGFVFETYNIALIAVTFIFAFILMMVISIWLQAGFYTALLKLADGIKPKFTVLFEQYRYIGLLFINWLVFSLFVAGIVVLTALAIFIPGAIVGIMVNVDSIFLISMLIFMVAMIPLIPLFVLSYFIPFITIDKNIGPISAIKYALAFSKGKRIMMSLYAVVIGIFMMMGLLLFILGILVTAPIGAIAFGRLYRELSKSAQISGYKVYLQGKKQVSDQAPAETPALSPQEK